VVKDRFDGQLGQPDWQNNYGINEIDSQKPAIEQIEAENAGITLANALHVQPIDYSVVGTGGKNPDPFASFATKAANAFLGNAHANKLYKKEIKHAA
jgi:hypothetical protein